MTDADGLANSTGVSATRFLTFGGATVATVTSGSPTPTWSLMLGDGQGSAQVAMELVPQASGTGLEPASSTHAVTRNAYLPFGATRGGDNLATSRGWLGQVADTDTGLIYLNARYYDPVLARFVSPDPLMNPGDPKTLDPYRYADNNPVMATDASGLAACYGMSAAAEKKCMGVYDKGSGYKPQAAGTHTPQKVKYDSLGAPIPSKQHSRNVIAQLAKDQAAAPSQLQVWLTPTKSTYMAGVRGEVNFLGGYLNGASSMVNGLTSLVSGGHAPKIGSVGIWGDYDDQKYSSWLGSTNATIDSFFVPGGNVGKAASFLSKGADAASAFSKLKFAAEGIDSFTNLRFLSRGEGGEVQIHHLIEQRFARVMRDVLGANTNEWASIAVTRAEHQVFTNAWRAEIPYGPLGTRVATTERVTAAAKRIYADYPEILGALGY